MIAVHSFMNLFRNCLSVSGIYWEFVSLFPHIEVGFRRCSSKQMFEKFCNIYRKTPVLEAPFNKFDRLKAKSDKSHQKQFYQKVTISGCTSDLIEPILLPV